MEILSDITKVNNVTQHNTNLSLNVLQPYKYKMCGFVKNKS